MTDNKLVVVIESKHTNLVEKLNLFHKSDDRKIVFLTSTNIESIITDCTNNTDDILISFPDNKDYVIVLAFRMNEFVEKLLKINFKWNLSVVFQTVDEMFFNGGDFQYNHSLDGVYSNFLNKSVYKIVADYLWIRRDDFKHYRFEEYIEYLKNGIVDLNFEKFLKNNPL